MLPLILSLLVLILGFTLAIVDNLNLPTDLILDRTDVGNPGTNPIPSPQVACSSEFGTQMDPPSCFDALDFAPRGDQQETWVPWPGRPAPPPRPSGVVQLPIVILGSV